MMLIAHHLTFVVVFRDSGKFRVRLGEFLVFWGPLVVTSAFAEVELVYERSTEVERAH